MVSQASGVEIDYKAGLAEDREDDTVEKKVSLTHKRKAFQNMLEMREELTYPKDFDYKKAVEEAVDEKYLLVNRNCLC